MTGQSLTFNTPGGQAASVTSSTVFENSSSDDSTAESATTGSAAVSTVSTTFDAASGESQRNPHTLYVAATTGIVIGDHLVATNVAGETEIIEVRQIISGVSIESRHPLTNDYVSADTVEGTAIAHAVDATWVAAKTNISDATPSPRYRWRLEYVGADGATHVHHAYFDLVRYSVGTMVTGLDVDAAYPWLGWLDSVPVYDREDRGARIIKEAQRQIKLKLFHAGKADQAMRNREAMEDLILHRAAFLVAGADPDARAAIAENFDAAYNNFIIAGQVESDADGSGAAKPSKPSPPWRR